MQDSGHWEEYLDVNLFITLVDSLYLRFYYRSATIDRFKQLKAFTLAYHYCDFRERESTKPDVILRTLLAQFLWAGWRDEALFDDGKRNALAANNVTELNSLLLKATSSFTNPVIIIDALDECQENEIAQLTSLLTRLRTSNNVSILVASRKEKGIPASMTNVLEVSLNDETGHIQDDIGKLVDFELSQRPRLSRLRNELKSEISSALLDRSDGM